MTKIRGTDIVDGDVGTTQLTDDAVTNAKASNMAQATIKGRASGVGTGDPTDLTGAQAQAILPDLMLSTTVTFASGGTFTKASHPGLKAVVVEVLGAGGGGGGSATTSASNCSAGSGGSGGGYSRKLILEGALAASETVTIGAGGTGVSGGTGTTGGTSSFGAHASATGGGGGQVTLRANDGLGNVVGVPGTGSGGDVNLAGGLGETVTLFASTVGQAASGRGGDSFLGFSDAKARATTTSNSGTDSTVVGTGGGGAACGYSQSALAGGAGADGVVIVTVYK